MTADGPTVRAPRSSAPVSLGRRRVRHPYERRLDAGARVALVARRIVYAGDRPAVVVVARYYSANVERHETPPRCSALRILRPALRRRHRRPALVMPSGG